MLRYMGNRLTRLIVSLTTLPVSNRHDKMLTMYVTTVRQLRDSPCVVVTHTEAALTRLFPGNSFSFPIFTSVPT